MTAQDLAAMKALTKAINGLTQAFTTSQQQAKKPAAPIVVPPENDGGVPEPPIVDGVVQSVKLPAYLMDGRDIIDTDEIPANGFGTFTSEGIHITIPTQYVSELARAVLERGEPLGFMIRIDHLRRVGS